MKFQNALKKIIRESDGIHSAGTGSQAGRQSEAGVRYSGSHAPSRDSSGSPVISDGIGRMKFWVTNILCSLLTVECWYPFNHFEINGFLNLARTLFWGVSTICLLCYTIYVWVGRANDLGEAGCFGFLSAVYAYLSLIILAHFLQIRGQDILRGKDILILLVCSVAGWYSWIKYGFVKGRHS